MKNRQTILSKIAYFCFYIAVVFEVLIVLIDKSSVINPIEGRLFQLTFIFFSTKVFLTKYTKREYFTIAVFLGLGALSYFTTNRNELVRIIMFVVACKGIDIKKCLKLVFYMTIIGCLIIMLLSLLGIGGEISLTQDFGRGSVETRYALGLGHPNALQCMIWALTVLALYLYDENFKWYIYPLLFGVNFLFFLLTDSKTSMLVAAFAIVYAGVNRMIQSERIKKGLGVAGLVAVMGSVLLSVVVAANAHHVYNYDWNIDTSGVPTFFKCLDKILTGRIRSLTGNIGWEGTIQTWSLFSKPSNNYYFDMGWVRLFYWYGIIPAVICIAVVIMVTLYCIRQKKYAAVIMITVFCVYTIIEAHAVSVYIARNYVLFLIGAFWTDALCFKTRSGA